MKIAVSFLILYLFFFPVCGKGQGDDISTLLKEVPSAYLGKDFQGFPFGTYVKQVPIEHFLSLFSDCQWLTQLGYDGALFAEKYIAYCLQRQPLQLESPDEISAILSWGQTYHLAGLALQDTTFFFAKISDQLYAEVTNFLQEKIDEGAISLSDPFLFHWSECLGRHQYHLNFPISDVEKGLYHLEEGNYAYLVRRVWTDHKWTLLASLGGGLLLIWLFVLGVSKWLCRKRLGNGGKRIPLHKV